jgi:hypothetical protein
VIFNRIVGIKEHTYGEGTHFVRSDAAPAPGASSPSPCRRGGAQLCAWLALACAQLVPWFDRPIIFDVRTRPRQIQSLTGSKGTPRCSVCGAVSRRRRRRRRVTGATRSVQISKWCKSRCEC